MNGGSYFVYILPWREKKNDKNHPSSDIWQMTWTFRYAILLIIIFVVMEIRMDYQTSPRRERTTLQAVLSVANFILVIVIAICFTYLYIDVLF